LFVLARKLTFDLQAPEVKWIPEKQWSWKWDV
jgi:hypothetical protein